MKKHALDFVNRGLIAGGFGPLVLAIVYIILNCFAGLDNLNFNEVSVGIISLYILAFIAGGMNMIYQIERLPLMFAILIHGIILYICYLGTFIVNGWLESGIIPIMVFTVVFIVGYLVIWLIIYLIIKRNTAKLNEKLIKNQAK